MVGLDLFTRVTLPPLWIADQVRNDGDGHDTSALWIPAYAGMTVRGARNDGPVHRPSGLRTKSAMTGRCYASFSPSPLIPLPSRERGIGGAPPCGYCLKASMTGPAAHPRLDSRVGGNDGPGLVVLSCCCPALWFLAYAGMTVMRCWN